MDEFVRNRACLVDEHAGSAAANEVGQSGHGTVGRLHGTIIAAPILTPPFVSFRVSERQS
jgi:hypothetical protein